MHVRLTSPYGRQEVVITRFSRDDACSKLDRATAGYFGAGAVVHYHTLRAACNGFDLAVLPGDPPLGENPREK